jgi:hypothetical protein
VGRYEHFDITRGACARYFTILFLTFITWNDDVRNRLRIGTGRETNAIETKFASACTTTLRSETNDWTARVCLHTHGDFSKGPESLLSRTIDLGRFLLMRSDNIIRTQERSSLLPRRVHRWKWVFFSSPFQTVRATARALLRYCIDLLRVCCVATQNLFVLSTASLSPADPVPFSWTHFFPPSLPPPSTRYT